MRLTAILQFYKQRKPIPGLLFQGKKQAIPKITTAMKANTLKWIMMEENNMALLQAPYLTIEEEDGYMKAYHPPGFKPMIQELILEQKRKRMPKHVYTEEHLDHLNVAKKWE
ncbi:hypothetical protein ScPMuIL_006921 [Solemya velum]